MGKIYNPFGGESYDILETYEELSANTESGKLTDSLLVKQLYSDLNVRYNTKTDYLQVCLKGTWHNVMATNLQITEIPTMTSNTTPYGVASASEGTAWQAFDKKGTYWQPNGINNWVQYEFPQPIIPTRYSVQTHQDNGIQGSAWTLKASNDGVTFTDLDARSVRTSALHTFDLPISDTAYKFYRLLVTETTNSYGVVRMEEFNVSGILA